MHTNRSLAVIGVALVCLVLLAIVVVQCPPAGIDSMSEQPQAAGVEPHLSVIDRAAMQAFLHHPGVNLINTRDWSDGGTRSWLTIDPTLTPDDITTLLEKLPVGASVQFFDIQHPTISDPGAFATITRRPGEWTVWWSNHGWSSREVPLSFERATRYMSDCYAVDWGSFLGSRDSSRELMSHHAPIESLKEKILRGQDNHYQEYLDQRVPE